jgi:hypothetical protein
MSRPLLPLLLVLFAIAVGGCAPSEEERHAAYWAIRDGDVEKLRRLLDENPKLANAPYKEDDRTPLVSVTGIYSPVPNRNALLRLLLERGADPNQDPYRLFGGCIYSSDVECMEILLQHGADPMARNAEGKSSLDYARSHGVEGMAEVIERHIARKGS